MHAIATGSPTRIYLGIDIGGTFTDLALVDAVAGRVHRHKILTSVRPEEAVVQGADELMASTGCNYAELTAIKYSTTAAANAVISRQGAKTGLLCTNGFRDVLANRREERYDLYDLLAPYPEPLVPRSLRIGVVERTAFDGEILQHAVHASVQTAVEILRHADVDSVAVAFLHAYANPANELSVARWIKELEPDWHVSLSSDVDSQIGEYERTSTTVINAYVQPTIADHLKRLEQQFRARGLRGHFYIVTSTGGVVNVDVACRVPVRLIESGPAAGVIAANRFLDIGRAQQAEAPGILAFDMGGTTAKSCFTTSADVPTIDQLEVARLSQHKKGSGLLIRAPSVDLLEIGSGGGSVASINQMAMLQVGPDSAGSHPGPICYRLGGARPTVTDADVVLGYINPSGLLAGRFPLDRDDAVHAFERLGEALGMTAMLAAWSVIDVVTESMANAIHAQAMERGIDARRFPMLAFGGAGPVHAAFVAQRLSLQSVVVPPSAGILSAYGCAIGSVATQVVLSYARPLSHLEPAALADVYSRLRTEAHAMLGLTAVTSDATLSFFCDLQYAGQRSTLTLPAPAQPDVDAVRSMADVFHIEYARRFGRSLPWIPIKTVNWRARASLPAASIPASAVAEELVPAAPSSLRATSREMYFPDIGTTRAATFVRRHLPENWSAEGPAVVEDFDTSIVVPHGWTAKLLPGESILLHRVSL